MNRIDQFIQRMNGAYSPHTIRAYKRDLLHLNAYCHTHDYDIHHLSPEQLIHYLNNGCIKLKTSTIRSRISCYQMYLQYIGQPNITQDPDVRLYLRKRTRQFGSLQAQARPLQKADLDKMLKACNIRTSIGLRNALLLLFGYHSMRRGSELCSLRFEDIRYQPNGKLAILLRRSKTDQAGVGHWIGLPGSICPYIQRWQDKYKLCSGPILRPVTRGNTIPDKPLHSPSINPILCDIQYQARIKGKSFSSHSFRVGGALDLLESGTPIEKIMLKGGWKATSTVILYLRAWVDI